MYVYPHTYGYAYMHTAPLLCVGEHRLLARRSWGLRLSVLGQGGPKTPGTSGPSGLPTCDGSKAPHRTQDRHSYNQTGV